MVALRDYQHVWLISFEHASPIGERPMPICCAVLELWSNETVPLWADELLQGLPFRIGPLDLVVAYGASAELGCFLELGWPIPPNVVDLQVEFRVQTNGLPVPCGDDLFGALAYFGLDGVAVLARPRSAADYDPEVAVDPSARALLGQCESCTLAIAKLLQRMAPRTDFALALLRGRYMLAVARMERRGIPIDAVTLERLRRAWSAIRRRLIEAVDAEFQVYEGRTFIPSRFDAYLKREGIPWPRQANGTANLDDDTFREMARAYPQVSPLRELRHALSQLKPDDLAVGTDGRNRTSLAPFRSSTGRNQPSSSAFIFGPSTWVRSLIKPEPGMGIAYIDWAQQEFGIAAALSGDTAMQAAYRSGDPYLAFAKQAGAVPLDATKESHPAHRERFKACALGVLYSMGERALAQRISAPRSIAAELLRLHRKTYRRFWSWSNAAVDCAEFHRRLVTTFGWTLHIPERLNVCSIRNFPMQANGAEMMRLACIFATEGGISVCAPIHDALLIEAPIEELKEAIGATQDAMARAARAVLGGFELRTDVHRTVYPDRYVDPRGIVMWQRVADLLQEVEACA